MMRIAGLVLTTVLLAGCGRGSDSGTAGAAPGGSAPGSDASAGGGANRGGQARMTAVEVAPVEVGSIARMLTVSGLIEPIRTVAVNSQLGGALVSIHAEEGVIVQQGRPLARIDDRELRARLAAAEAAYEVARSAYERAEQLSERRVITLPEFERDRTAEAAARAERDQLRTRLEFATVVAPISGVVTEKHVEAGDIVAPQSRLFAIADLSTLVVRVQVSELDVVHLHAGDPVDVALDAVPDGVLRARIRRVFPAADPNTRLVPIEVALDGAASEFARPGFLARTTFSLGRHDNVVLVPASALIGGGRTEAVFVVDNGTASRRPVTTGMTSQGRVEIVEGLRVGEQVVVAGNNSLQDGAEVRIVAPRSATPGTGSDTRGQATLPPEE